MIVDEALLRAYVDGELDAATRQQVEVAMAHSAELQAQVEALRASCLPYRAAFDAQALPLLPQDLQRQVAALVSVAAAPAASSVAPTRRRAIGWGWAAAASFAAGLSVPWRPWQTAAPAAPGTAEAPWVQAIASYHALYVRETVDQQADAPSRLRELLAGFDERQRAALSVPDLRAAGLQFKRVQRLGFGNMPLIQMVFLPAGGRPAALCMLPIAQADAAPTVQRLEGLAVASWTRGRLAHVLVADLDEARVLSLAQALNRGDYARASL
jgi:anti-sigma factor RsiW